MQTVLIVLVLAAAFASPAAVPAAPLTAAATPSASSLEPSAVAGVSPPCAPTCPPGAVIESEADCSRGYVDAANGGCNFSPAAFHDLGCSDADLTVCGRYGTFAGANGIDARDTDWYRIGLLHPATLTVCGCADGHLQLLIIDARRGCPVTDRDILAGASTLEPAEAICVSATLTAGAYFIWAGAAAFDGVDCGSDYVLTVSGYECPTVEVEPARWGAVKSLYLQ